MLICQVYSSAVGGLAATSLINIAFGASSAYLWFCILWGTNGLLQVATTGQKKTK